MARPRTPPPVGDPDPPVTPIRVLLNDYFDGMQQLAADARWRWLKDHYERLTGTGPRGPGRAGSAEQVRRPNQGDVAVTCGNLDPAVLSHCLSRGRNISPRVMDQLEFGFRAYQERGDFVFNPFRPPDPQSKHLSGCLRALNEEGRRRAVTRSPVGLTHLFCLHGICADARWLRAVRGETPPAEKDRLAREVYTLASREAANVSDQLEKYAHADRQYRLDPTYADLMGFFRVWHGPWRSVSEFISRVLRRAV